MYVCMYNLNINIVLFLLDSLHSWFRSHHFNLRVLECINDGESFVRASALAAIVYVSKRKELWQDLLQQTGKTEVCND